MDATTAPQGRASEAQACTSPTAQRPLRPAEFDELFSTVPDGQVEVLDALADRALAGVGS